MLSLNNRVRIGTKTRQGALLNPFKSQIISWLNLLTDTTDTIYDGKTPTVSDIESQLDLIIETPIISVQLVAGWNDNVVYTGTIPKTPLSVFQSLINAGYLIKVMDIQGNAFEDWTEYGFGWNDNIGNLTPEATYSIQVTTNCSFIFA